jgi:hypothetical protein
MAEPYYGDDGEQIGWVDISDDGETYLLALDREIAGVWDDEEQGFQEFESGYFLTDPDADEDPLTAYEERLDELEQRLNEPTSVPEIVVTRATEQADVQGFQQDMGRQREHLERMLDRPLTLPEARRLGQAMLDDFEAGSPRPDIIAAAERTGGLDDLDADNPHAAREARRDYMTQRLLDSERMAAAEHGEDDLSNDEAPARQEQYDADSREERQAWMVDALRGVTDSSALYSSDQDREQAAGME